MGIINPDERYCIDLLYGEQNGPGQKRRKVRWDRNKGMRKHLDDFRLTVNSQFELSLRKLRNYHIQEGKTGGTWCTEELIKLTVEMERRERERQREYLINLQAKRNKKINNRDEDVDKIVTVDNINLLTPPPRMEKDNNNRFVRHYIFELWEGHELVAVTAGFGIGRSFHDYSMATLKRDDRGIGHILTKTVGHLLTHCNYEIWYWGCKIGYMAQYDQYGGRNIEKKEFLPRWVSVYLFPKNICRFFRCFQKTTFLS